MNINLVALVQEGRDEVLPRGGLAGPQLYPARLQCVQLAVEEGLSHTDFE